MNTLVGIFSPISGMHIHICNKTYHKYLLPGQRDIAGSLKVMDSKVKVTDNFFGLPAKACRSNVFRRSLVSLEDCQT